MEKEFVLDQEELSINVVDEIVEDIVGPDYSESLEDDFVKVNEDGIDWSTL